MTVSVDRLVFCVHAASSPTVGPGAHPGEAPGPWAGARHHDPGAVPVRPGTSLTAHRLFWGSFPYPAMFVKILFFALIGGWVYNRID